MTYAEFIEDVPPVIKEAVEVGNFITPDFVLEGAVQDGVDFGNLWTQTRDPLRPDEIEYYNSLTPTERLLYNMKGSITDNPLDVGLSSLKTGINIISPWDVF